MPAAKPAIRRWGPCWSRHVAWCLNHVYWNTTVIGQTNIPAGRAIIAANHVGIMDGPVVHGAIGRGSHFLVKQEFFDSTLGFLMTGAGQIPVDRSAGRAALMTAHELLEEDRIVGIFPEGTRGDGSVSTVHAGVAWLALHTGAPVVPTAVLGTRLPGQKRGHIPRLRAPLHVEFGVPVQVPRGRGRAAIAAAVELIGKELAAHVHLVSHRTGIPLPIAAQPGDVTAEKVDECGSVTED